MARNHNTDRNGNSWSEETKLAVWQKGNIIWGESSDIWRKDKCGEKMKYSEHGNRDSLYGWEIDHINPATNGGGDNLSNLQPLHWRNNASKGDKTNWRCS